MAVFLSVKVWLIGSHLEMMDDEEDDQDLGLNIILHGRNEDEEEEKIEENQTPLKPSLEEEVGK